MKNNKEIFEESLDLVCKITRLDKTDILSKSRVRSIVNARKTLVYYMKSNYDLRWVDMANMLNLNHATIIHYYKCINDNYMYDRDIRSLKFRIDLIDDTGRINLRKKILGILNHRPYLKTYKKVNALLDLIEYEKENISR